MRSSANVSGHPIHPALIPFPIAFLVGAFGFDLAGLLLDRPALWQTGWYLAAAGVVSALVAAVPGVIDYVRTVPPDSSAKQRATRHGIVNVTATILFAATWLIRGEAAATPSLLTLALQAAGVALLVMGGWMGGTLVYRNQIGVDHRFARAGKWSETRPGSDAVIDGAVDVAAVDELELDQMKLVVLDDRRLVLARAEDGYVAFDDRCTHKGGALSGGSMMCGRVHCPWHGSQFDVRTGAVHAGPAEQPIRTYAVEERNGRVFVRIG